MKLVTSAMLRTLRAATHLEALRGGAMIFFTGTMPNDGDAPAGVAVAALDLPDPAGSVADGAFTLAPDLEALVFSAGTISWARFITADISWLYDMDCGLDDSGAALILDKLDVQPGATLTVRSLVFVEQ